MGGPSFRLSGGDLNAWGQDRLWQLEADMVNRVQGLTDHTRETL